ncbi:hypothetical protein STEG23_001227, partial [Scotinomys teguina]
MGSADKGPGPMCRGMAVFSRNVPPCSSQAELDFPVFRRMGLSVLPYGIYRMGLGILPYGIYRIIYRMGLGVLPYGIYRIIYRMGLSFESSVWDTYEQVSHGEVYQYQLGECRVSPARNFLSVRINELCIGEASHQERE